ncbi:Gfo/Idh/MocA family protein [Scatolibacter rhodanostii]|uniref:Gfo/Idh/MocA family protein n=1 Tax=Scatolibacter rhodanostii TaxID=2014781 RepID=UPI000C06F9E4|nr:Gfo/Idh/MocA family oxidoreductase [Scatolibacter rhodanostii]
MKKVRLGVIGVGNMGTAHITNIISGKCPEIEVTAVADVNPERLEWAKSVLPSVAIFENAEKMLDSGLIDAALVSVPHYDHPTYAHACFERGIHVMVEKPAGVFTKSVREMNEAAKKSDVVFGMMFNQRTDYIYRKMREIVKSGELGEIKRTNWIITDWYRTQNYYNSGGWRATWAGEGGGVLLNQCPHNLDLWQWICGMPKTITAKMYFGKWHDIEVEDDVTCFVEYENKATGVFVTTTGDTPGTNRFEITLDGGKLVAENGKLLLWKNEVFESEFTQTSSESFGKPKVEYREIETDGESLQHVGVLNAFAGAILRGEPLVADGSEGISGLTIANAIHLSAWTNSTVTLPIDEELFYSELKKHIDNSKVKKVVSGSIASDMSNSF